MILKMAAQPALRSTSTGKIDPNVKSSLREMWGDIRKVVNLLVLGVKTTLIYTGTSILTSNQLGTLLWCSGTINLTLPPAGGIGGQWIYFVNTGTGTISILGTINGDASGYQLVNQYQYVEVTSDGTKWFVTSNN